MPATIQRTVNWTGTNTTQNPNFEWVNVNSVDWVTRAPSSTVNQSDFTIDDNTTGAVRTSQWEVRHWNWVNDNTLVDSFTITQDADGAVSTTTSTTTSTTSSTTSTTTSTTSSTTSTTTNPPVNYTLTLDSGTNSGQPLQIQEVGIPQAHTIGYTLSPSGAPQRVGSLPAWLTENIAGANQNSGTIQLQLNPDTATYPADSQSTTIKYKHNGDSSNSSEVTIYIQFVAAPANSILVTTSATVVSEAPNGEGESTYTDDNSSASNTQAVAYTLELDPDVTLTSSEVYWSDTLPSASGHLAQPSPPYWATALTIDNTPSSGQAQISYSHVDPNAGIPNLNKNTPLTEEQAGTQSTSSLPANQRYVIARHPDDTSHWVAILVTAPLTSITTTTTAAPSNIFYWSVPGGTDGNGTNAGILYPADYGQYSGPLPNYPNTNDHSVTPGDPYVAGSVFWLWAEYNQPGGTAITTAPSGGWTQHITTPSYIDHLSEAWDSTRGMWKFQFGTDQSDSNFPTDQYVDRIAQIHCDVTSTRSTYRVIIDANESCHVTGTVMNLADGSTKLIEDLQVGDVLASYDIAGLGHDETTSTWQEYSSQINQFSATSQSAEVKNIWSSEFGKYVNFNNGLTKVTEEHPVLVKDAGNNISFKQVFDVVIGESFYINGAWVEITSKEVVEETITAYKIDVEELDVYLADGILWHNTVSQKIN